MGKVNISKIIKTLIIKQKIKVIGVMYKSKVDTKGIPFEKLTNEQIFDILINELPVNENLRINLGSLIDQEFDLTALNTTEDKSNAWGSSTPSTFGGGTSSTTPQHTAAGNALRDNAGNILNTGLGLISSWLSPKPSGTTGQAGAGTGGGGTSDALLLQIQMQNQSAAQAAAAQAASDKASSRNTMLIVGVIGGLVVVGGIIAIVVTRK